MGEGPGSPLSRPRGGLRPRKRKTSVPVPPRISVSWTRTPESVRLSVRGDPLKPQAASRGGFGAAVLLCNRFGRLSRSVAQRLLMRSVWIPVGSRATRKLAPIDRTGNHSWREQPIPPLIAAHAPRAELKWTGIW
jgi:hypothetical protein